ncbi:protein translocase subunit SecD [Planctomycetota bacterium]
MQKQLVWKIILVLAVVVGMGFAWHSMGIDLGLDLRGGAEILYRVHIEEAEVGAKDIMGTTIEVITRRINQFGVGEYRIERSGDNHILLQLPDKGEAEIDRIKEIIKTTGKLTFHLVASEEYMKEQREAKTTPPGYVWKEVDEDDPKKKKEELLVREKADFSGDSVNAVQVVPWQSGIDWAVKITLDRASRTRFAVLTRDHKGERLAIILDGPRKGKLYSAPSIKEEIKGGIPYVTGDFGYEEAETLAGILLSGRLPAPISVEYENIVGPSLGQDSIQDGVRAIAIGMALVVVFMALYYLGAGIIANIAVICNLVILLGILAYLDATLTLPGLAGIVLLVGMSVDANVLIFERIREEIDQGKPLSLAVRNGYQRVFITIFDANLTTMFTAIILFWAGTGPVRGFAVTLGIGLGASMFTSLFATRAFFELLIAKNIMKSFKVFSLIKRTTFTFSKYWKVTAVISIACITLGLATYYQRGREMYDIDFLGGSLIHLRFAEPQNIDGVRNDIAGLGQNFQGCQVQNVWSPHAQIANFALSKEFEIRMELPADKEEHEKFLENMKATLRTRFANRLTRDAVEFTFDGSVTPVEGGSVAKLNLRDTIDIAGIQKQLAMVLSGAKVTGYGKDKDRDMCNLIEIRSSLSDAAKVKSLLERELSSGPFPRTRKVSGDMAQVMIWKAIRAMVIAMIGIVIYMAFRFQLRFGIGAVVALVHDVLITMGALAAVRVEVNLPIIAAFLTIIGYSLNDTIVVFDRVRENMKAMKGKSFVEIIDTSVNQTLGRTLLTSATTLFAAGALFVWGGGVIHNFAYALIVGVVVGTYSSIFVATPVVALLESAKE